MIQFFLTSTELIDKLQFFPRQCDLITWFKYKDRELALIRLKPHLRGTTYNQNAPIQYLALMARDILPLSVLIQRQKWPILVNICTVDVNDSIEISLGNIYKILFIDIGIIYLTERGALGNISGSITQTTSAALAIIMDASDYCIQQNAYPTWMIQKGLSDSPISIEKRQISLLMRIYNEYPEAVLFSEECIDQEDLGGNLISTFGLWKISDIDVISSLYNSLKNTSWIVLALKHDFIGYLDLINCLKRGSEYDAIMKLFPILLFLQSNIGHNKWQLKVNPQLASDDRQSRKNEHGCLFGGFSLRTFNA